jgi:hypothetical protein
MFWREFSTATAATKAFRQILNTQSFKTPLESELLSDLIAETATNFLFTPAAPFPPKARGWWGFDWGVWGDLAEDDNRTNDLDRKEGGRLLSRNDTEGGSFYVITEWDRSMPTLMLREEY